MLGCRSGSEDTAEGPEPVGVGCWHWWELGQVPSPVGDELLAPGANPQAAKVENGSSAGSHQRPLGLKGDSERRFVTI